MLICIISISRLVPGAWEMLSPVLEVVQRFWQLSKTVALVFVAKNFRKGLEVRKSSDHSVLKSVSVAVGTESNKNMQGECEKNHQGKNMWDTFQVRTIMLLPTLAQWKETLLRFRAFWLFKKCSVYIKQIISNGSRCQSNLMVSEGPITFVWILHLQITSRVANVDDNSLTCNRPSQKIIREMLAQLAIFLPLKEFFSM